MKRRLLPHRPAATSLSAGVLLLLATLGCGVIGVVSDPHNLAGVAYWAAATGTAVPTQTRFLGMTTPVYAPTVVPALITLPPSWVTTTPAWTTVTATPIFPPPTATPAGFIATPYWVTTAPEWVTTTPIYITETPEPPVTTTPALPIIGFTTPVPQETPYYRVGSFYMHSDVYVGGPDNLTLRLINFQTAPSPRQPEASFYYFTFRLTNQAASETVVPLSDLAFIRTSQGETQRVTGRWQPQNEPLLAQGLPLAASQLATPLPPQSERVVTLGITAPAGDVTELGLLTNWQRADARPIWFMLQPDPTGPYQDAAQPPLPTPIVLGMDHSPGDDGTPGSGQGMWPTTGVITRGYGCHAYFTGIDGTGFGCPPEQPWFHNGVDIANGSGTAVWSPVDGAMLYAGPNSGGINCAHIAGSEAPHEGLGNYQRVSGQGTTHYLGHLRSFSVTSGSVHAGQTVAEMGSTGCSTGPHLHWMVYAHGQLIDPAGWAGPGP